MPPAASNGGSNAQEDKKKSGRGKKGGDKSQEDIDAKISEIIVEGPTGAGGQVKMEVDYSETVAKKIPEARALVQADKSKLPEALEVLTSLEKQTRSGGDAHSTGKVLVAVAQLCFECGDWRALNENVITLSKKRSQLKAAVAKMVQQCYEYVKEGKLPSRKVELELIETLRQVRIRNWL